MFLPSPHIVHLRSPCTQLAHTRNARPSDVLGKFLTRTASASLLTCAYVRVTAYYFHAAIFEALCVQKNTGVEVIII